MIVIARGNWQAVLGAKIRRYKQNFGIKSFYIKETPQILDCRSFLFFCDLFMQCTLRVQGIIRVNIHKFFFCFMQLFDTIQSRDSTGLSQSQ